MSDPSSPSVRLSDQQIERLLEASGIVAPPGDRQAIIDLARHMLAQAALISGPLPLTLEPIATPLSRLSAEPGA